MLACSGFLFVWWLTALTLFETGADGRMRQVEQAPPALEAAGGADVAVAGGAQTVNQFLAAGLLDELRLHVAPVVLGGGARLFEGVGRMALEPVEVSASPAVTHLRYRAR